MLIQCRKIGAMKNLSIVTKRALLIVGLIIVTIMLSTPANAGQEQGTSTTSGSDLSRSAGAGLRIPLSDLLSLDLNLSSVGTGPSSTGERGFGAPPVPVPKASEFDLHYTRFGVGFSFKF